MPIASLHLSRFAQSRAAERSMRAPGARSRPGRRGDCNSRPPGGAVRRHVPVVIMIAILDPLRNIAVHVVEAESIGLFLGDRMCPAVGGGFVPGILVELGIVIAE